MNHQRAAGLYRGNILMELSECWNDATHTRQPSGEKGECHQRHHR